MDFALKIQKKDVRCVCLKLVDVEQISVETVYCLLMTSGCEVHCGRSAGGRSLSLHMIHDQRRFPAERLNTR